jgi:hypothetical protein
VFLTVVLVGMARPPPVAEPALTNMKAAPTASSPEVCQVAMLQLLGGFWLLAAKLVNQRVTHHAILEN